MRFIDAGQVHGVLDFPLLVEGLERLHREPPPLVERALLTQEKGDQPPDHFLIWPAWQPGAALGAKLITSFPENATAAAGLPSAQGVYVLFDGADGRPLAAIDGTALTYRKTAADSALGAKHLARPDARLLLMVGAGALAPYLIAAHRAVRPVIDQVLVWNRTPERAAALAARVGGRAVEDLAAAVAEADLVCCATRATAPLVQGAWLKPGAHLDLVGGFTNEMREADDAAARRARVFVDSRWFTIGHCGDISGPLASGVLTEKDIEGDLFDLSGGRAKGRRNAEEITLFKNAGGAHLDLMTARLLLAQLEETASEDSAP